MTKRTLLIDGDVVAFEAAAALEEAIEWETGYYTWHVSFDEVCAAVDRKIEKYMDKLNADDYKLALTDPYYNFRLDVLPSYKGNRSGGKRPLVLLYVKLWMADHRNGVMRKGLEGDDVMGILATYPAKGERIIVSIDKDMKTIPCTYVRDLDSDPVEITEDYADWWHLTQTLTGDVTDGYAGCPSIGIKRAADIIQLGSTIPDNWQAVVAAYAKAGLGEEEALRQARVARILRSSDYNFKTKEPILWTPPK
ncbi:hypothetical protein ACQU0X_08420 [Pseudovibrio ascidiaceicola]|uniref:hypothetical protein n=1 Tax=Pseudovibrio ascidiaceicola TaxID=285279 RepID=UPI003D35B81A